MDGSYRYLSPTVISVVDLIRVRQAYLKCSNRFRKSVGKPMNQIQNVGIVYHGKSRQYMTKPRLAFLHEHVPTVLGFFHFRLLSILQYLPTVCRSIQQPFASPHPQTSILPNIRRHPPNAAFNKQGGLSIFLHVPVLHRQPDASGSLRSSFASGLQHGVRQQNATEQSEKPIIGGIGS